MATLIPNALDFHDWLPIRTRLDAEGWRIDWARFGTQPLAEPFFRDSTELALRRPFNQVFRRDTAIDALLDWQQRSPGIAPTAFVFHASRCGSTLIARMLSRLPGYTVLSEPSPLDALLRAHYTTPPIAADQPTLIRAMLSAYGQRRRGTERALVVKLDAWNIFELPLLRQCFPTTPWLFLYRDPLEIVVSQIRQPGMHLVPGLIGATPLAFPQDEVNAMSHPEFVARTIGRMLAAGLEQCRAHGGLAVNYDELPDGVTGRLASFFGLAESDLPIAQDGSRHNAKHPHQVFQSDRDSKHRDASDEIRAAVDQWARGPYAELEALRLARVL
ncbi:aspartyl beta-hydroxylase [Andreprevotia chitinilytica]|uniref:aspartyl beta-hydroxylase n=1 Tax=Andreprevotia chitinilytica TaxID=396808 RepID=UPI0005590676|nr:aspartyl beta-hydroxylase [Andreprevotia chitinilytica]